MDPRARPGFAPPANDAGTAQQASFTRGLHFSRAPAQPPTRLPGSSASAGLLSLPASPLDDSGPARLPVPACWATQASGLVHQRQSGRQSRWSHLGSLTLLHAASARVHRRGCCVPRLRPPWPRPQPHAVPRTRQLRRRRQASSAAMVSTTPRPMLPEIVTSWAAGGPGPAGRPPRTSPPGYLPPQRLPRPRTSRPRDFAPGLCRPELAVRDSPIN